MTLEELQADADDDAARTAASRRGMIAYNQNRWRGEDEAGRAADAARDLVLVLPRARTVRVKPVDRRPVHRSAARARAPRRAPARRVVRVEADDGGGGPAPPHRPPVTSDSRASREVAS